MKTAALLLRRGWLAESEIPRSLSLVQGFHGKLRPLELHEAVWFHKEQVLCFNFIRTIALVYKVATDAYDMVLLAMLNGDSLAPFFYSYNAYMPHGVIGMELRQRLRRIAIATFFLIHGAVPLSAKNFEMFLCDIRFLSGDQISVVGLSMSKSILSFTDRKKKRRSGKKKSATACTTKVSRLALLEILNVRDG